MDLDYLSANGYSFAVLLVCASVVSYVTFVLSLSALYFSFCWCLGKIVLRVIAAFLCIFTNILSLTSHGINIILKHLCKVYIC